VVHVVAKELDRTVGVCRQGASRMIAAPAVATDVARGVPRTETPCGVLVVHRIAQVAYCGKGAHPGRVIGHSTIELITVFERATPVIVFKYGDGLSRAIKNLGQFRRTAIVEKALK